MLIKKASKVLVPLVLATVSCYTVDVLADNIASIASTLTTSLSIFLKLMTGSSYLAGFGLTISALFKFKTHKDNPTQEPLSKAIVTLVVGIALIFLPSIISVGGSTFGFTSSAGISGVASFT